MVLRRKGEETKVEPMDTSAGHLDNKSKASVTGVATKDTMNGIADKKQQANQSRSRSNQNQSRKDKASAFAVDKSDTVSLIVK